MRRKPDPEQRRRTICDAAIRLLAGSGSKGLSHLKVDREAGFPDGTTSFYFRTRSALLRAVAERVAELDLADMRSAMDDPAPDGAASRLARLVVQAGREPQLTRTKARYELTMAASRDPEMAEVMRHQTEAFNRLHHDILGTFMPPDADPAVIGEVTDVTLTFINGLLLRFAHGDRVVDSAERLDEMMSAIITGILLARTPTGTASLPCGSRE
ncbi:TetR/AcrR family transcriptional regulator [Mycobacterium sp. PS03-16]|uniref:TetR/AcrR family transcriptional regulator n=1 Tax=Mycobacterium sp. PS03-16 TaxID=2559611 RepID=UPI0010736AC0|nr:TetR/AcrR family transcriptional regulator [Mycobacterium sp. PS03-16]TFV55885.1 TetR/AcrR family transcriptional regulator [Mycobacterium sp. PS03-16]